MGNIGENAEAVRQAICNVLERAIGQIDDLTYGDIWEALVSVVSDYDDEPYDKYVRSESMPDDVPQS